MSSFRIKPKFKHYTDLNYEELEKLIKEELAKSEDTCVYRFITGHMKIQIPEEDRHYWSPELNLNIEEEDGKTVVIGRYGPDPKTWTTIVVGYAILGLLTFFIGIYGSAKYSLGLNATILWLIPLFILLALGIYIIAQFGQKLGAKQMYQLHFFYERIIGQKIKIS